METVKQQYREAVEENGRLEARIQAFAINAQSEQDVLSSEVNRNLFFVLLFATRVVFDYL